MATALQDIHHSPYIWRGKERSRRNTHFITSGINSIDQAIGGWPLGALIEFASKQVGIGEFSLLTPVLRKLSQQDKWIALICPPYIPYAPALSTNGIDIKKILVIATSNTSDTAWAMDQAISSKSCSAVVGWFSFVTEKILRRLQLAIDTQETLGAYFINTESAPRNVPTPWRITVDGKCDQTIINITKRRGGMPVSALATTHPVSQECCGSV